MKRGWDHHHVLFRRAANILNDRTYFSAFTGDGRVRNVEGDLTHIYLCGLSDFWAEYLAPHITEDQLLQACRQAALDGQSSLERVLEQLHARISDPAFEVEARQLIAAQGFTQAAIVVIWNEAAQLVFWGPDCGSELIRWITDGGGPLGVVGVAEAGAAPTMHLFQKHEKHEQHIHMRRYAAQAVAAFSRIRR